MEPPTPWNEKPAGFWIRAGAQFLDGIALFIIQMLVFVPFAIAGAATKSQALVLAAYPLLLLVYALYYTLFTSAKGATPGKMLMGIQVVKDAGGGGKVGFGRALGRFFSYFISSLTLAIGYLMAGFTDRKRALHDMIAGTRVVRTKPLPVAGIVLLCAIPVLAIPVMGILAAVAIPQFSQNLEKAREGATKGNLSALKSAISIYYGDTGGDYPKSLTEPPFLGKYIDAIPPVKVKGASSSEVETYDFVTDGRIDPDKLRNTGHWVYDRRSGIVALDNTGTDSRGTPYHHYGYE